MAQQDFIKDRMETIKGNYPTFRGMQDYHIFIVLCLKYFCNGVQREHNKKLNNGLPILHKVPPKRDYGRYFCILAEKGGTSHGGLTEKLDKEVRTKSWTGYT